MQELVRTAALERQHAWRVFCQVLRGIAYHAPSSSKHVLHFQTSAFFPVVGAGDMEGLGQESRREALTSELHALQSCPPPRSSAGRSLRLVGLRSRGDRLAIFGLLHTTFDTG